MQANCKIQQKIKLNCVGHLLLLGAFAFSRIIANHKLMMCVFFVICLLAFTIGHSFCIILLITDPMKNNVFDVLFLCVYICFQCRNDFIIESGNFHQKSLLLYIRHVVFSIFSIFSIILLLTYTTMANCILYQFQEFKFF